MSRDPEEIRSEIEETREELADTAAALAYKTDVKARAKDRVEEVKSDVREKVGGVKSTVADKTPESAGGAAASVSSTVKSNPIPTAAIAAAVLGFALGYLISRRD
jgi:ElaB/YqjD/DUF883 family membrane-anchored ribosome-binding protein